VQGWGSQPPAPHNDLHPLASICSDHAPVLLKMDNIFSYKKRFHFRALWPRFPGCLEMVELTCHCPFNGATPLEKHNLILEKLE
jgi:hypothetical protein